MSGRRFWERVDDWLNPIVVKELRQAVQSKMIVSGLFLFLFIQVLILGGMLVDAMTPGKVVSLNTQIGRQMFEVLQGVMLGTCLLVPAYVGGRLSNERSDTHTDLMFITSLKPRSIVSGKFFSGLVLVLLIFSACTPFMTFAYLLRGIDIPSILLLLLIDLILAMAGMMGFIFLAVIPAPRPIKALVLLAGFGGLLNLFMWGMYLTNLQIRGRLFVDARDFWVQGGMAGGLLLAGMGLLFSWSVAILSPPSSNKALLVRLYTLGIVLLMGLAAYLVGKAQADFTFLMAWVVAATGLSCVQLFISCNEREHLGYRVAKTIPRSPALRPFAFLLYSGSAGGILFSTLLLGSCILAALTIATSLGGSPVPPASGRAASGLGRGLLFGQSEGLIHMTRFAVLAGLYTYCFCLTSLFVRVVALRNQVKTQFTWIVNVLVLGVGSAGPYLVAYFIDPELLDQEGRDDPSWLWTNPFFTIDITMTQLFRSGATAPVLDWTWPFAADCMVFVVCWASLATLVMAPWFIAQIARFRPPEKVLEAEPAIPLVLAEAPAKA